MPIKGTFTGAANDTSSPGVTYHQDLNGTAPVISVNASYNVIDPISGLNSGHPQRIPVDGDRRHDSHVVDLPIDFGERRTQYDMHHRERPQNQGRACSHDVFEFHAVAPGVAGSSGIEGDLEDQHRVGPTLHA